jgi:hypothetical protein
MISFVLGIISATPTSAKINSPLINRQLSTVSSETSSLQSSGQFEFDELPTWTPLSDGSSVTSPTDASDHEMQVNNDVDSDVDEAVPRKRQKTRTGSNARIAISNVPVKSQDMKYTIVDGGPKKHKLPSLQNFDTPTVSAVDSEDTRVTRVAISNTEPSPTSRATTSISSCVQIDPSPTTVITTTPALSQNAPVKEGKEGYSTSTHSRKGINGLSGLLVSRPLSTSTSDFSNSGVLKGREEPTRKARGLALRPTNWSYGTKLKGRIADEHQLESFTNADVAHIGFRKPDELKLFDQAEEESTKRNVSHLLKCLMEKEAKRSSENVERNEGAISNSVQTQLATTESVGEKRTSGAPERTLAVDGLEGHEDEETRDDMNSPLVPLPQLEDWSTTLRSLLKGKKRFQHQVCCDSSSLSTF